MNIIYWILCIFIFSFIIITVLYYENVFNTTINIIIFFKNLLQDFDKTDLSHGIDKFGMLKIYPTKPNGREWFVNMENPYDDNLFNHEIKLVKQNDGGWRVTDTTKSGKQIKNIRMNVITINKFEYWKNIEISGYVKIISYNKTGDSLIWYARGIQHSDKFPCQGSSLKGRLSVDGTMSWKKEIWHTGGYTNERGLYKITEPIIDKWIGWKVIMYNIKNDTAVRMESYLDLNTNNRWIKVSDIVDDGNWFAKTSDDIFYSVNCGKPKDYVITNSGPVVTFRSDNLIWDFKNLSVREISPAVN